jgi:hypothetical protein
VGMGLGEGVGLGVGCIAPLTETLPQPANPNSRINSSKKER